jgi:hypothetical protein
MSAKIIPIAPRITSSQIRPNLQIAFNRLEFGQILNLYGRMVASGHWKDYAVDMLSDQAIFSVYRQASEMPLYQIVKRPALRNKQGQFSVMAPGGLILKRGHELKNVLRVFDSKRFTST